MENRELETRIFKIEELRAEKKEGEAPEIAGYAALFNSLSTDLGGFVERIRPGAFNNSLLKDVRAFWNHNSDYVLGRTKAGTLELAEDEIGLRFALKPPKTQWAQDALESLKRGDVDQMSFGFRTLRDDWEQVGDQVIRTLIEVELFEVSPVAMPAYPQTSVQARSVVDKFISALTPQGEEEGTQRTGGTGGQAPGQDGQAVLKAQARRRQRLDFELKR